jgi:hypothetical protein
MFIKWLLSFILLFIIAFHTTAQSRIENCLQEQLFTAAPAELTKLTDLVSTSIPDKSFYFVGEAHTFLANNDLQLALLKSLHQQSVYNVVCELPHATCFMYNQYLENGDEAILSKIRPAATYNLLINVRQLNQSLPADKQIRYYGIDYLSPRHDLHNLLISLKAIRKNISSASLPLDTLIDHYIRLDSITFDDAKLFFGQLNKKLLADSERYRPHFGNYYDDLLLMSSNMLGYRPNRDSSIFESFQVLFKLLAAKQKTAPKFLAFYGIGHLDNLGRMLQENKISPVKAGVGRIGIHYVNCWGGWTAPVKSTTGLFKIDKKELAQLVSFCEKQSWEAGVLMGKDCLNFRQDSPLDALFIFNRYGDRKMNSWKFD